METPISLFAIDRSLLEIINGYQTHKVDAAGTLHALAKLVDDVSILRMSCKLLLQFTAVENLLKYMRDALDTADTEMANLITTAFDSLRSKLDLLCLAHIQLLERRWIQCSYSVQFAPKVQELLRMSQFNTYNDSVSFLNSLSLVCSARDLYEEILTGCASVRDDYPDVIVNAILTISAATLCVHRCGQFAPNMTELNLICHVIQYPCAIDAFCHQSDSLCADVSREYACVLLPKLLPAITAETLSHIQRIAGLIQKERCASIIIQHVLLVTGSWRLSMTRAVNYHVDPLPSLATLLRSCSIGPSELLHVMNERYGTNPGELELYDMIDVLYWTHACMADNCVVETFRTLFTAHSELMCNIIQKRLSFECWTNLQLLIEVLTPICSIPVCATGNSSDDVDMPRTVDTGESTTSNST